MNWWQYLLLVNIYLVLFYAFYVLLLRKETFFQLNRVYLVAASLLSFFIPLIQMEWVRNLFITQQVKYTIYSTPVMVYNFKPIAATQITVGQVLTVLYGAGILLWSLRLMWELVKLRRIIKEPKATVAYSFFKKVRLSEENESNHIIEAHEQVHAQQWHSADVMLIELVMIINWFNPIVYMYRFAIKHIHEYIADRQAVQAGTNKADYALLLLSQTFNAPAHQLVNPFFNKSLLRQRIIMLQKNKSQRISLIKYGLSAPLFILMLILSSATINNSKPVKVFNNTAHQLFTTSAEPAALGNVFTDDDKPAGATDENNHTGATKNNGPIYTSVERVPEFPGGLDAFGRYLGNNIKYPAADRESNIQGRVIVTFVVEADGSLSNLKVLRGVSKAIDDEAVRVLQASPKWSPGMQNGQKVRVQYSVPVSFTLADESDTQLPDTGKQVIFKSVDQVPEFPGGLDALGRFLMTKIRYPKEDRQNGTQGRVIVTFVVETDGSLSGFKVNRGVSKGLDDEAMRVLKLSPKWSPGIQNGKPVRVQYSIPISFTLNNDKTGKPVDSNKTGKTETGSNNAGVTLFGSKAMPDTVKAYSSAKTRVSFTAKAINANPLYLLDGKIIDNIVTVDPNTIESISVIKGEAATAIYGSKAVNGVIVVTSKSKKAKTAEPKSN